jgi:hypothetical protein
VYAYKAKSGKWSVDVYIPAGNSTIVGVGIFYAGTGTIYKSTLTKGSWVTLEIDSFYNLGVVGLDSSGDAYYGTSSEAFYIHSASCEPAVFEIDLTQSAADIQDDLSECRIGSLNNSKVVSSVVKDATTLTLFGGVVGSANSLDIDITNPNVDYSIEIEENQYIKITYEDLRRAAQTYTNQSSIRLISTASEHGLSSGSPVAIFAGDTLISTTYAVSIPSTTSLYIPAVALDGKDNTATHIGANSGLVLISAGVRSAPSITTHEFYIPGVSSGIATPLDISLTQGEDTEQAQMEAISGGSTYLTTITSELRQVYQNLYQVSTTKVVVADLVG